MTSRVFYRKWRPQTLAEVAGQGPVTQTLLNALSTGRISHAYLFCGPRGTGKTSTARALAKAVNCLNNGSGEPCNTCEMCKAITELRALDVIEIDAASNTGVDDIRSLREKVNYSPNQARYKVYIIDEVHMLSNSAANALLKTLEEPPPHVIFILATTEIHKILPTILSRCQRFDFRRVSQQDVIDRLSTVCRAEGITIDKEGLRLVARSATGSMRDALNLLEQLTAFYGSEITLTQVQTMLGVTGDARVKELAKHIINADINAGMATIGSVNNDGLDLKQFTRELVEHLRALLLIKTGSHESVDMPAEDKAELKELSNKTTVERILKALKLFGQLQSGFDNYPTLPLELALVDCAIKPEPEPGKQSSPVTHQPQRTPEPETKPQPVKPSAASSQSHTQPQPQKVAEVPPETIRAEPPKPAQRSAPVTAPQPVAAGAAPLEGATEIERLKLNWRLVIEHAPQETRKTTAWSLLRSAGISPVAIDDDTVVLTVRYPIHKEKIEISENQKIAEKIISNFLGRPCRISCITEDNHLLKAALKLGAQRIDAEET